jgi:phage shock protein C
LRPFERFAKEGTMLCAKCQRDIADYSNFCYYCGARQQTARVYERPRRVHRSLIDSKIAGVCGGLAEYFDMDPTLVRLLWVIVTVFTGFVPGIFVYLLAWIIMPVAPIAVQPVMPAQQAPNSPQA